MMTMVSKAFDIIEFRLHDYHADYHLDTELAEIKRELQKLDDIRRAVDIGDMSSNDIGAGLTSSELLGAIGSILDS